MYSHLGIHGFFVLVTDSDSCDVFTFRFWVTDKAAQHVAEVSAAEAQKSQLITEADNVIAPLERAVKRDMATDEDKTKLDAWECYSVLLSRVDTDKAPDIEWSDKPE